MSGIIGLLLCWFIWSIIKKIIDFLTKESRPKSSDAIISTSVTIRSTGTYEDFSKSVPPDKVWLPKDKSVVIAGYTISGGMLYVGKGLSAPTGWSKEAALINPDLPVDKSNPDRSGQYMSYWPSYSDINPASRAAYLEWLADGAKDPNANMGYVFLYFYGLERRLLCDTTSSEAAHHEIDQILLETERLLKIYSSSRSFKSYATRLINMAHAKFSKEKIYEKPVPDTSMIYENFPLFKLGLAQMAADNVPLPADWAIFLMRSDPEARLRTSARRCKDEFDNLFKAYYSEKFGKGILLSRSNTKYKLDYYPASSSLRGAAFGNTDLWDASVPKAFLKQLRDIADTCMDELDAYSRFIGKKQEGVGSIEALALFPTRLLGGDNSKDLKVIEEWCKKSLDGKKYFQVDHSFFIKQFSLLKSVGSGKKESLAVAQLLSKVGIGLEPDIRFWAHWPGDGKIVLFNLPKDASAAPSSQYSAAVAILHLAAAVMHADGRISPEEESHFEKQLENWLHLDQSEMVRLRAHSEWLLSVPQSFSWLTKRMQSLDKRQTEAVGKFLVDLAQSDGHINPDEVRALTKIYSLLGLDPNDFYKHAHIAATEPVKVESILPNRKRGYPIPARPPIKDKNSIDLDMDKIKEKMTETAAVSAVLSSIFSENKEVPPKTPKNASHTKTSIMGLDHELSAFVRFLITKSSWTREELELRAAENKLMLDGTLDSINDAFYAAHNKPLFEGEDIIDINDEMLKEVPA